MKSAKFATPHANPARSNSATLSKNKAIQSEHRSHLYSQHQSQSHLAPRPLYGCGQFFFFFFSFEHVIDESIRFHRWHITKLQLLPSPSKDESGPVWYGVGCHPNIIKASGDISLFWWDPSWDCWGSSMHGGLHRIRRGIIWWIYMPSTLPAHKHGA